MKIKLSNTEEKSWNTEIQRALDWRAKFSCEKSWSKIDAIYAHKFEDDMMPHFNLLYMMGQTIQPALVFQTPGIINTPVQPDAVFGASVFDSIDNWWMEKAEVKEVAKELVLSSYLHNTTAIQIGYDFDTAESELKKAGYDFKTLFGDVEGVEERNRSQNVPWLDCIPSHRFVTAVGTTTMRSCAWCAKFLSVPKTTMKKMGYKNIHGCTIPEEIMRHERALWEHRDPEKYVHFWQIHDALEGTWMWLSNNGTFIVKPEDDPLQVYGLPFEVLSFNRTPSSIWGTPDAMYIASQQAEGDECRKLSMFMRRLATPKCFYDLNAIKPDEVERFLSSEVGAGIGVNVPTDKKLSDVVLPLTPPTQQFSYMEYMKGLLNDAQLINGFGPNQLGTYSSGRNTKYEAQVVEQSNNARLSYRRNQVADVIKNHTARANYLIANNWKQDSVRQVVGADGMLYWVKATPDELKALKQGLVTNVNVESLAPVSRERRKMEARELLALLGTMQEAGANPLPILKQLLSTYEWVDVRQVLPQYYEQMTMQNFQESQEQAINQGGVGGRAVGNLQGLNALAARSPEQEMGGMYERRDDGER